MLTGKRRLGLSSIAVAMTQGHDRRLCRHDLMLSSYPPYCRHCSYTDKQSCSDQILVSRLYLYAQ